LLELARYIHIHTWVGLSLETDEGEGREETERDHLT